MVHKIVKKKKKPFNEKDNKQKTRAKFETVIYILCV